MFDLIHEFAVLGTTLFMMAVRSIWYAPMVGGRYVAPTYETGIAKDQVWKYRFRLFGLLLLATALVAFVMAHQPITAVSVGVAGALGLYALLTAVLVLEQRLAWREYCVHLGFFTVWLIGSVYMLNHWPW